MRIEAVDGADLPDLLPLMRAYCDFYEVAPADAALEAMARALIADPDREGVQLIARGPGAAALGFATVFWSWQTLSAGRVGVMNDLFVAASARQQGMGKALIEQCRARCREHGAGELVWETALDNEAAQRLYRAVGASEERWLTFSLPAADG